MSNKLFVGGLSWDTTDQSLREAFERFGTVLEAKVITDRDTGRSRGFGFVTMESAPSAKEAMEGLDGTAIDGRNVRVNEAQDRRGGGGGGGGRRDDRGRGGHDRDREPGGGRRGGGRGGRRGRERDDW